MEQGAKCAGPVDTSAWHLTYTDGEYQEGQVGVRAIEVDYVAVVCRERAPRQGKAAVALETEHDDSRELAPIMVHAETQRQGGASGASGASGAASRPCTSDGTSGL